MDWERTHRRLVMAERQVSEAEWYVARARLAIHAGRDGGACTLEAQQALKSLEARLEHGIAIRDRLKNELRLLTH